MIRCLEHVVLTFVGSPLSHPTIAERRCAWVFGQYTYSSEKAATFENGSKDFLILYNVWEFNVIIYIYRAFVEERRMYHTRLLTPCNNNIGKRRQVIFLIIYMNLSQDESFVAVICTLPTFLLVLRDTSHIIEGLLWLPWNVGAEIPTFCISK